MSYSGPITIYEHNGWKLDSYGHGAAYTLTDTENKRDCFFQGDDAVTFRDLFDNAFDSDDADKVIDLVFSEYSEVMEPIRL